jgi:hypothetical protein
MTASKRAHTPGPWHVHDGRYTEIFRPKRTVFAWPDGDPSYGPVAVAFCDFHTPEIAEANARLIAAAPDLLAAAKRALNVFKSQGESVRPGNVLGALEAAIAKAEGAS